jgi:cyclopropane fatty-acyl-phospholipid synthase-like methyltransferase
MSAIFPYESSSEEVVRAMLEIAKVGKNDLVYDLGCGDGRIVIAAAQKADARWGVSTWILSESRKAWRTPVRPT